ncbi:tail chaperone [Stenotrophomonas phage Sonora]|nr:tail chaperone [Stenotrophomonas phage Sonora]
MNPLYAQYKTDQNLEKSGILFEAGEITENGATKKIRFRIARAGGANEEFNKALERESKPFKRAIQTKTLSNKKAEQIYLKAFISSVLLGWENVRDQNNNELAFNTENALALLSDLPDLFADLREAANDAALFREEELEIDLGNSGASSNTDSK